MDYALGQLLTAHGDEGAIEVLERALARWTELYGDGHPHVAALDSLPTAYSASGNLEELCGETLVAESLSTLGMIKDRVGRYEEALALHERSLAIRERVRREHPDIAEPPPHRRGVH